MKSIAVAVAVLALLAGCAGPVPSPTTAPLSASPTPTPEPTPEALVIPGCDTLVPLPLAQSLFSPSTESFGELDAIQFGVEGVPEAADAVAVAAQSKFCGWGIPSSDGALALLVAEIAPADRATVEAALAAAGFSAVTMGTVTGYDAEREGEVSSLADTVLFTGDVMIVCNGTTLELTGPITNSALDALRTANPALGL
jgi:hypothetical protein